MTSPSPWLALLVMTRVLGATVAVVLLVAHRVTPYDGALILAVLGWTAGSLALVRLVPRLRAWPVAWLVDVAIGLLLVWLSRDWRSPMYLLALTTLVLPVTSVPFRHGVLFGSAWAAGYAVVAVLTERLGRATLEDSIRAETAATHLMVPVLIALALGYASDVLRRLRAERERSERLAVHTERQRIAWELHDSAKQQVHAAHLVLSALPGRVDDEARALVDQALEATRAAAADMDMSVAELRMPLDGRPVDVLLRRRAEELSSATDAAIRVDGRLPELSPTIAAHAYRIAAEALTNAVRHAGASEIRVELDAAARSVTVRDDGAGLPATRRPGSHGLRTMRDRAHSIGAEIDIGPGAAGRGTTVHLVLPNKPGGAP